ncbi:MAG: xylose isomerase, partial [Bacteroidetes bacterium]|nr:xylose isomerase [Bacteroidota bacterium]
MYIQHNSHLSYCTNIHAGESWEQTFQSLRQYTTKVRDQLGGEIMFGIGLRLSNQASLEILEEDLLSQFKDWLSDQNMYVFTLNGFPYGGFHHREIKDKVHIPDWASRDRVEYTIRLFDLLSEILPKNMDGGISTSPL